MFNESSDVYDLIYSFKDYEKESIEISKVITSKYPNCKSILDVGCGTAEHHKYLKGKFSIDGIDLNPKFIEIAQKKNPAGKYSLADMANFDLQKKFDVILCLFSSIGYLSTLAALQSTLQFFNKHLHLNGLVIVEPWFTKENYHNGKINMLTYDKEDIKICRIVHSYAENDFSILHFHYLVATPTKGFKHFDEIHQLRMFSKDEIIDVFKQTGYDVEFDSKGLTGRGLYYGVKRTDII